VRDRELIASDPLLIEEAYERGLEGAYWDAAGAEHLLKTIEDRGQNRYAEDACSQYGIYGAGEGKLSLPYRAVSDRYPEAIPGRAQERGDCVSFSTRTAIWISYMYELQYGSNPDKHSIPELSDEAVRSGCISSEALYWYRGHSGEGWQCAEAAEIALTKSAMWIRRDYPELGFDLTKYSPQVAGKWGRLSPPAEIVTKGQENLCQNTTVCRTYESVRDMLATGNAISSCGSEAFEKTRNKYGVASRSRQTWHHAMAYGAVDDRPETIEREGCGLILVINSWGNNWISGERGIPGTDIEIPHGSFWAKWTDLDNRYAVAMGASAGWPARIMPNWGLGGIV